jgi:cephalosporin hydroxylase
MTEHDVGVSKRIQENGENSALLDASDRFLQASIDAQYSYNFTWLGRPIIQYPQDIVAMQELLWRVQPDLVIETGIAHGGSLLLSASLLELNAACGGPTDSVVVGIDIELRPHNREAIESHPLAPRIRTINGSSTDPSVVDQVSAMAGRDARVLVCLDSLHTHDHVLAELEAYAGMVTLGSYCIVFDTVIERLPVGKFPDRPWEVGDNPMTAVDEFLDGHPEFVVDERIDRQLMVSASPRGYLRRIDV